MDMTQKGLPVQETGPVKDYEPEEDLRLRDPGELPLIDPEMFFDLLMEQQEQM